MSKKEDMLLETNKQTILNKLSSYGIIADIKTGNISYCDDYKVDLLCNTLYLLRHAETIAVANNEFMSDFSDNSRLTNCGKETAKKQAIELKNFKIDIAFYGPIPRVINTMRIIMEEGQSFKSYEMPELRGIDNKGWEYRTYDELKTNETFIQREIHHNIFAKTEQGTSWADVLCNCIDVIEYLNRTCVGKNILLISQGSVHRGLGIVLHKFVNPWDNYFVRKMFNLNSGRGQSNYGLISQIQ